MEDACDEADVHQFVEWGEGNCEIYGFSYSSVSPITIQTSRSSASASPLFVSASPSLTSASLSFALASSPFGPPQTTTASGFSSTSPPTAILMATSFVSGTSASVSPARTTGTSPSPPTPVTSGGLSTAAKAGIGAGCGVACIVLIGALAYVVKSLKNKNGTTGVNDSGVNGEMVWTEVKTDGSKVDRNPAELGQQQLTHYELAQSNG